MGKKTSSPPHEMQPRYLDGAPYPAFIPYPRALHPAPSSCPDTTRQAESPVKKRPFTVEFLLSNSPPKVGRRQPSVCHVPVYPEAGCGDYPVPGNYPVLFQGAGYRGPLYSAWWNMYCPGWRAGLPVTTHSIPVIDRKAKRFRAIFTQEQLAVLESEFKKHHYIIGPQRVALASALGLTVLQVKVWFQNRRIKWKKEVEKSQQVKTAGSESRGKNEGAAAEDVSTTERLSSDLSKN
ncbi:homeobox protein Hox-A7-like [Hypanus sabinus]|uniref:homeobox protein Hox-A7-like n=1 Tax=Hypanus sabinus TaxID=79690 RepID=UPI0028C4BB22|nr:homeobox protein Hox-A7-like [Hypanus sabinus]